MPRASGIFNHHDVGRVPDDGGYGIYLAASASSVYYIWPTGGSYGGFPYIKNRVGPDWQNNMTNALWTEVNLYKAGQSGTMDPSVSGCAG